MQDLDNLYNYLRQLESCRHFREVALKQLCKVARYELHPENSVVYKWDFMQFTSTTRRRPSTSTRWHFVFALCCRSNETHAPVANLPSSTQLVQKKTPTCVFVYNF